MSRHRPVVSSSFWRGVFYATIAELMAAGVFVWIFVAGTNR